MFLVQLGSASNQCAIDGHKEYKSLSKIEGHFQHFWEKSNSRISQLWKSLVDSIRTERTAAPGFFFFFYCCLSPWKRLIHSGFLSTECNYLNQGESFLCLVSLRGGKSTSSQPEKKLTIGRCLSSCKLQRLFSFIRRCHRVWWSQWTWGEGCFWTRVGVTPCVLWFFLIFLYSIRLYFSQDFHTWTDQPPVIYVVFFTPAIGASKKHRAEHLLPFRGMLL